MAGLRPLGAQVAPRGGRPELSSDSAAWQNVLTYVVNALSANIVAASADSALRPWRIQLPADEPQRLLLERQLKTILRARPATDDDTVVYTLGLGPLFVRDDGAWVRVRTNVTRRCANSSQVTGSGSSDSVFIPRTPWGGWGLAHSVRGIHGDGVPCPRPRR